MPPAEVPWQGVRPVGYPWVLGHLLGQSLLIFLPCPITDLHGPLLFSLGCFLGDTTLSKDSGSPGPLLAVWLLAGLSLDRGLDLVWLPSYPLLPQLPSPDLDVFSPCSCFLFSHIPHPVLVYWGLMPRGSHILGNFVPWSFYSETGSNLKSRTASCAARIMDV